MISDNQNIPSENIPHTAIHIEHLVNPNHLHQNDLHHNNQGLPHSIDHQEKKPKTIYHPKNSKHHPNKTQKVEKKQILHDINHLVFSKGNFISVNHSDIKESYNFNKKIGSGSYGEVWDSENKITKERVAIKIIPKINIEHDEESRNQMKLEFSLLRKLDHPNVFRIFDSFETHSDIYIVGEYLSGGELAARIQEKVLSELEVCNIMQQILKALAYCHSCGVAHRDIKPENIMYETKDPNSSLKLIDFGLSAIVDRKKGLTEILGSQVFMAPEMVHELPYTEKVDIWACGIMMFSFLCSKSPYDESSYESLSHGVETANFTMDSFKGEYWDHVSLGAKEFILKMLKTDPNERASAQELLKDQYFVTECPVVKINPQIEKMMIQNFMDYSKESALQRLTRNFIASQIVTSEAVKEARREFAFLDKDNDGKISKEEWINSSALLARNLKIPLHDVEKVFEQLDTDKSNSINYTEFLSAALNNSLSNNTHLLENAFHFLDKDNSGYITSIDFKNIFKGDYGKNKPFIDKIIEETSSTHKDQITKEEFVKAIKKVIHYHHHS